MTHVCWKYSNMSGTHIYMRTKMHKYCVKLSVEICTYSNGTNTHCYVLYLEGVLSVVVYLKGLMVVQVMG